MIETADLSEYFLPIYFIALAGDSLLCGQKFPAVPQRRLCLQTDGSRQRKILAERVPARAVLKTGASRAVKKAATAPNLLKEIRSSLLDSCYVLPKVISLLTAVGIIAMLIATYTVFAGWQNASDPCLSGKKKRFPMRLRLRLPFRLESRKCFYPC